eukprot:Lithocolla_globosa_v1_NODE_8180_length_853_cov_3.751880.p1 type:complete len:153 gc:universal NODE_8180_length_853_cov_3.751880:480-22(-)
MVHLIWQSKQNLNSSFEKKQTVHLISGQNISRPTDKGPPRDLVSTYIELQLYNAEDEKPQTHYSPMIETNGFNPYYDNKATFTLQDYLIESAMIRFVVYEAKLDSGDAVLAVSCLPLSNMMLGYRYVQLCHPTMEVLDMATLFVSVSLSSKF